MAFVSTYLNFEGDTLDAFTFYKSVFGTEFSGPVVRMGDGAAAHVPPEYHHYVMHVTLPILAGHLLMGTDAVPTRGSLTFGKNVSINLSPDTRAEADALFAGLSAGGTVEQPMTEMPWGYFGLVTDRYKVQWMFNVMNAPTA